MKNYKTIVEHYLNNNGCDNNVSKIVKENVNVKVRIIVWDIVYNNIWITVVNKVIHNHNPFNYNSIQQYKNNL